MQTCEHDKDLLCIILRLKYILGIVILGLYLAAIPSTGERKCVAAFTARHAIHFM
jgi:hypothetical protein